MVVVEEDREVEGFGIEGVVNSKIRRVVGETAPPEPRAGCGIYENKLVGGGDVLTAVMSVLLCILELVGSLKSHQCTECVLLSDYQYSNSYCSRRYLSESLSLVPLRISISITTITRSIHQRIMSPPTTATLSGSSP